MHRRVSSIAFSLTLALLLLISAIETTASYGSVPGEEHLEDTQPSAKLVRDLWHGAGGVSFVLDGPEVQIDPQGQVTAAGLDQMTANPGKPGLPYFSTYVALPPGTTPALEINVAGVRQIDGSAVRVLTEPAITLTVPDAHTELRTHVQATPSQETYLAEASGSGIYPQSQAEISDVMYLRDLRLVRLSVYPVRYDLENGMLLVADAISLSVEFQGYQQAAQQPSPWSPEASDKLPSIINGDDALAWRHLPADFKAPSTELPLDTDVYKIHVNHDGIYEVSYADLLNAGMNVNQVDPNTFEMLYRGDPLAFDFVGDADTQFEPGEKIRFYGWAFDGPRLEKQFVNDNIYWLWAGGNPTYINTTASASGTPVSSFRESITREPETIWFPSWTDQWDQFPNEPDAWYWYRFRKLTIDPITATLAITLPHPNSAGQPADLTAEFSSKPNIYVGGVPISHEVSVRVNDTPNAAYRSWIGVVNLNVTGTVPISDLVDGQNAVEIVNSTASANWTNNAIYLNRITIDYDRLMRAVNDSLIFDDATAGSRQFNVAGFSSPDNNGALVWDITNPLAPLEIPAASIAVSGSGPYTYTFGTAAGGSRNFIVTTFTRTLPPVAIHQYVGSSLDPAGGAEWVAVAHSDFITETDVLAAHRENPQFGDYSTHVVDINDVINQYGYGLPTPSAVKDYLSHALGTWPVAPEYLLLVGDATVNPHNNIVSGWPVTPTLFVLTDLPFVDRFNGQIPSDLTFSLLVGDDLLPELAVGRIPARSAQEVSNVVGKIILYEQNHLLPAQWMNNILFVADNTDAGGNFCLENFLMGQWIPSNFDLLELCLPDFPTNDDASALREQFFTYTNEIGVTLVNYRGHGGVNFWGGNPDILNSSHLDLWSNSAKPVVIMTGDCLDGFFAYPPAEGLGETFLKGSGKGSAAHFSSSGLGVTDEHSLMVRNFYKGLFIIGRAAVGDAANYAKSAYYLVGGHQSLIYSYVLQGDPAMQLMRPDLAVNKVANSDFALHGELVDFVITIDNSGLYPTYVTLSDTLPPGVSYITHTSDVTFTTEVNGGNLLFHLQYGGNPTNYGLPRGHSATITMTAGVAADAPTGLATNIVAAIGKGSESWPGDEVDTASLFIGYRTWMPFLNRD